MSGVLYLELLSDPDLRLVAAAAGIGGAEDGVARLRERPALLEEALAQPAVYDALLKASPGDPLVLMSPFLVFALMVNRASGDLSELSFVHEWVAPGQRIPVFDVAALREFAAPSSHRLFLAELLASYTHLSSGSVWVRSRRGWRKQRYNELDPMRLAGLLEVLPDGDRGPVYRRLGDLALFLSGVFPDNSARTPLEPRELKRLAHLLDAPDAPAELAGASGTLDALDWLGSRCYRLADAAAGGMGSALTDVAERFAEARRLLNFLTDRYLFPVRQRWFGIG